MINRNKALKKGLDPEAFTGKYPPKINTSSKYERRVDRRTFGDKKTLFEGGWEELYKQYIEKNWTDRNKEHQEKEPKLMNGILQIQETESNMRVEKRHSMMKKITLKIL